MPVVSVLRESPVVCVCVCVCQAPLMIFTWKEVITKVESMIVVTRGVPVSAYQLNYLNARHAFDFSEVQAECELIMPTAYVQCYVLTLF